MYTHRVEEEKDLENALAGGVVQPGIAVRATDAGVHAQRLAGNLLGGELAAVGHQASLDRVGRAVLLPGRIVGGRLHGHGVLDPLDDLGHGDKVHLGVVVDHLVHPVEEGVEHFLVVLEPGSMVEQAQGCTVLVKVTVEVVSQEVVELVSSENVGAGVNHGTARKIFINCGIFTPVKLVHHHLPHGMGSGGAPLKISMASVRHSEVHGIRPERRILKRSGN